MNGKILGLSLILICTIWLMDRVLNLIAKRPPILKFILWRWCCFVFLLWASVWAFVVSFALAIASRLVEPF